MQKLLQLIQSAKQKHIIRIAGAVLLGALILWKLTHISIKAYLSFSVGIIAPIIIEGYFLYYALNKEAKKQLVQLDSKFGTTHSPLHILKHSFFYTSSPSNQSMARIMSFIRGFKPTV